MTHSHLTIGDLVGSSLRAWLWGTVRKSTTLSNLIARITNGTTTDQLFYSALQDGIKTAASYLQKKKTLNERTVSVLSHVADFLLMDPQQMQEKFEKTANEILPSSAQDSTVVQQAAKLFMQFTQQVQANIKVKKITPADEKLPKKVLATLHHHHPDALQTLENNVMSAGEWNDAEKFLLRQLFVALNTEAQDAQFIQNGEKWKNVMKILNAAISDSPSNALLTAGQIAMETVGAQVKEKANDLVTKATDAIANAVEKLQSHESYLPPAYMVSAEEVFKPAESTDEDKRISADQKQFFPLGGRGEVSLAEYSVTHRVQRVETHSHAHLGSEDISACMVKVCDNALEDVRNHAEKVVVTKGYCVSTLFHAQRDQIALTLPSLSYGEWGAELSKATLSYGWSLLGYQHSPADSAEAQQLKALFKASGWSPEVMQQTSHFLTREFAEACFAKPFTMLSTSEDKNLVKLDSKPTPTWARMDPTGQSYAYEVQYESDSDTTIVNITASWPIQSYGHDEQTNQTAIGNSKNSAVTGTVQVRLKNTVAADGSKQVRTTIYPLGLMATIHNVVNMKVS